MDTLGYYFLKSIIIQAVYFKLRFGQISQCFSWVSQEESAQVPEPRTSEWKTATDSHYAWWDEEVDQKKSAGQLLTITAEFGLPNYMWTTQYTYQPEFES